MQPTQPCVTRLTKEYKRLLNDPVPNVHAKPDPNNILEWHFVLEGASGTAFAGGVYHGKLLFPPDYPFKPPGILFVTPNGRFKPNHRICLSISDYHPEAWNPVWHVAAILNATVSFMYEDSNTAGAVVTSVAEKRALAKQSLEHCCKSTVFKRHFPDYARELQARCSNPEPCAAGTADAAALSAPNAPVATGGAAAPVNPRRMLGNVGQLLPPLAVAGLAVGVLLLHTYSA